MGRLGDWLRCGSASVVVLAARCTELHSLAMVDRFGAGEEVRLLGLAGSALGSRSVFAGVVLRRPALLSVGLFAGHAV